MLVLKRSSILGSNRATSQERGNNRISRPKIMRHEKHQDPSSSGTKWTYVVIVVFCESVGRTKKRNADKMNK